MEARYRILPYLAAALFLVLLVLLYRFRTQPTESTAPATTSPNPTASALAPAVQQSPTNTPSLTALAPQRRAGAPPILPRTPVAISVDHLADLDPPAFAAIMNGLVGNRPAIRDCVLKLQKDISQPLVLKWDLVLDVQVEDRTARITDAFSEEWPDALSDELRECFATSFLDYQFDTDEAFAYRFIYPMQLSIAPSP